ncbi:MAG: helix-turn-helix domain-containing protein [Proteobacteria bacterium]|nr:MAG: helix-turn-helix domain-containing protein [Pseudomonadota bacterium]TDJ71586.1 MAG: helix-turn-helix domain-containing protein [Pseudomonadota bacterium]
MTNPNTDSSDKATASAGPGKTLCDARKQLGFSPEEVAEILNLSTSQINALENDDFAILPESTYVRGYLRSYAQVLELSPDDILAAYANVNGTQYTARLSTLSPESEVTLKDRPVRFATFLVVGLLIVLAVVWWQGRSYTPTMSVDADTAGVSSLEQDLLGPDIVAMELNSEINPGVDELAARAEFPATLIPSLGETDTSENGQSLSLYKTGPDKIGVEGNTLPSMVETPSAAAGTQLVVYTHEASWADIRDARENRLLYMLLPAGRMVTLVGTPPFNVFLGNPDGVSLEFDGEYFDASRYKSGTVARFTLGVPAANNN